MTIMTLPVHPLTAGELIYFGGSWYYVLEIVEKMARGRHVLILRRIDKND